MDYGAVLASKGCLILCAPKIYLQGCPCLGPVNIVTERALTQCAIKGLRYVYYE